MEIRDVAVDCFLFVSTLSQRLNDQPNKDAYDLFDEARRVFDHMEKKVAGDKVLSAKYEKIKYPLTALVDEVVLTSGWPGATNWPVLELQYFGSQVGGNAVYDQIAALTPAESDLFEIYFHVLTLGFRGMYHDDQNRWEEVVDSLYRQLPDPWRDGDKLTPAAYHVKPGKTNRLDPMFSVIKFMIVGMGIMLLSIILYLVAWNTNVAKIKAKSQQALEKMANEPMKNSLKDYVQ